jgi:hypothetical protein
MKPKVTAKKPAKAFGAKPIFKRDTDFEALRACCRAIDTLKEPHMIKATLDFLNTKYYPQRENHTPL